MGVLGAFVFAAQMVNFAIPGTGSSGHLGGGLLLAVLLGPHAAFLVIASVLLVQALFFADGGLLALGCNIFNLGFFPAFLAYPLVYRPLSAGNPGTGRRAFTAVAAAVLALQLGAFSVVVQTMFSGLSALPLRQFVLLMQPIHLAIGLVEGLATFAILEFVRKAEPDILLPAPRQPRTRRAVALFLALALLTGGALAWFASKNPDGLEWALSRLGGAHAGNTSASHRAAGKLQERTALMPDYAFKNPSGQTATEDRRATSLAGILGSAITVGFLALALLALRRWRRPC
jgi:cobalt/nickel transport system permease protein